MEIKGKGLLSEDCAVVDLRDGGSLFRRSVLHDSAYGSTGRPRPEGLPLFLLTPPEFDAETLCDPLVSRNILGLPVIVAAGASPQDRATRSAHPRKHVFVCLPCLLNHDTATTPALC